MVENKLSTWSMLARAMLWSMTTAFVLLFLLDLAVILKLGFAIAWTSFAMFLGTLLWFCAVVVLIWEGKAHGNLHRDPDIFIAVEIFCLVVLVVSLLGHFYDELKMTALIFDLVIALVFSVIFVSLCIDLNHSDKKYRLVKK